MLVDTDLERLGASFSFLRSPIARMRFFKSTGLFSDLRVGGSSASFVGVTFFGAIGLSTVSVATVSRAFCTSTSLAGKASGFGITVLS